MSSDNKEALNPPLTDVAHCETESLLLYHVAKFVVLVYDRKTPQFPIAHRVSSRVWTEYTYNHRTGNPRWADSTMFEHFRSESDQASHDTVLSL